MELDLYVHDPFKRKLCNKWVFKLKRKSDGDVERCKARLVGKDFDQTLGIDDHETLSPVIKLTPIRLVLSLVVTFN